MHKLANPLTVTNENAQVWRPLFLRVLRNSFTIREAAEAIGLNPFHVRAAMQSDPDFAKLVVQAQEDSSDMLETEMKRRAMAGSDLLMIFALKAEKPNKYRDKVQPLNQTVNMKTYIGFSPDEWDKQQALGSTIPQVIDGALNESETDSDFSAINVAESALT